MGREISRAAGRARSEVQEDVGFFPAFLFYWFMEQRRRRLKALPSALHESFSSPPAVSLKQLAALSLLAWGVYPYLFAHTPPGRFRVIREVMCVFAFPLTFYLSVSRLVPHPFSKLSTHALGLLHPPQYLSNFLSPPL